MVTPSRLAVILVALGGALVLLDRIGLWAEQRGWIYWRRRRARGNALGATTLELQKIFESQKVEHVIVARQRPKAEAPDPGGDDPNP
jgi:hypothetical protein